MQLINKEKDYLGLKPYIYYSCRYRPNSNSDFVITYSLDNYIAIQGIINGKIVNDAGYLYNNIQVVSEPITYRNIGIYQNETIKEKVYDPDLDAIKEYEYIKLNGVKYYKDSNGIWFSIMNGQKYPQNELKNENTTATQFYKDAYLFTYKVLSKFYFDPKTGEYKNDGYGLQDLNSSDAVDEYGNKLNLSGSYKIFEHDNGKSLEDENSNFNEHRREVIRYSIEKNLSIAIANYNNYSDSTKTNFQMPKLKEDEWEKVVNNISIISFLQGLNIGGKVYNGYSIITNNKNEEVVKEDSIYLLTDDGQYHRANDLDLVGKNILGGYFNVDFERKSVVTSDGTTKYFIPKEGMGCYSSIVTQTDVTEVDNFYQYMAEKGGQLAQKYFTALGRERYGMYRPNNNPKEIKQKFGIN